MTFTDPKISEVARILHQGCHPSVDHEWADHKVMAGYVTAYFTSSNTERRISEAHTLGIKAGTYATEKTVEKLQAAVEQLGAENRALRRRIELAS